MPFREVLGSGDYHTYVVKGHIFDRSVRHPLDQAVPSLSVDPDIAEYYIAYRANPRSVCSLFDIYKDGVSWSALVIIWAGIPSCLDGDILELDILINSTVFHIKPDAVLGIPYYNIAENTMLDIPRRAGTQLYCRVIADEYAIGYGYIFAWFMFQPSLQADTIIPAIDVAVGN